MNRSYTPRLALTLAAATLLAPAARADVITFTGTPVASTSSHVDAVDMASYAPEDRQSLGQASTGAGPVFTSVAYAGSANSNNGLLTSYSVVDAGARAEWGRLAVSARTRGGSAVGPLPGGWLPGAFLGEARAYGYGVSSAQYQDQGQLNISGLAAGSWVSADFAFYVSGTMLAGTSGDSSVMDSFDFTQARYQWGGRIATQGFGSSLLTTRSEAGQTSVGDPIDTGLHVLHLVLQVGSVFDIELGATADATLLLSSYCGVSCDAANSGFSEGDFSHTFKWGGLLGLRDASGAVIDSSLAQMASASGFDYLRSFDNQGNGGGTVPLPGTLALALAGLALLSAPRVRGAATRGPRPSRA